MFGLGSTSSNCCAASGRSSAGNKGLGGDPEGGPGSVPRLIEDGEWAGGAATWSGEKGTGTFLNLQACHPEPSLSRNVAGPRIHDLPGLRAKRSHLVVTLWASNPDPV